MGVNNVNAKQQIVQLALKKKGSAQVRKNPQLVYLSKNGSIFDAPGVNPAQAPATTPTRATIQDLNTRQSLDELNKKPVDATGSATDTGSKSENEESGDVSLGNVKSATSQTKGLTSDVKADAKTATKLERQVQNLKKISKQAIKLTPQKLISNKPN